MRIIAVVMGEPDSKTRNSEVTQMLDYAFAQYELETPLSTNSILGTKEVEKGKEKYVTIVPTENVSLLHKKIDEKKNFTYDLKVKNLVAPLKVGDIVGTIDVKDGNNIVKKVNVTVSQNVDKANILELYWTNLIDILSGNINF